MRNNSKSQFQPQPFPLMTSPRLRYNILANYAGAGWAALMSFIFVPWNPVHAEFDHDAKKDTTLFAL